MDRKYSNQTPGKRKKRRGVDLSTGLSQMVDTAGVTLAIPFNMAIGAVPPLVRGKGVRSVMQGAADRVNKSLADVKARNLKSSAEYYDRLDRQRARRRK